MQGIYVGTGHIVFLMYLTFYLVGNGERENKITNIYILLQVVKNTVKK